MISNAQNMKKNQKTKCEVEKMGNKKKPKPEEKPAK